MKTRQIYQLWPSQQVSDGAGVKIRRSIGLQPQLRLDPFLMLDCFGSEQADEYLAGFPSHPHRGFETVTYMLDGHMLHQDHLGNQGHLKSGGVQWMTAGSGIIHSEMPQQSAGLMRGFQLWLNLPANEKMKDPAYVDLAPEQLTHAELPNGNKAVVIAGTLELPALQLQFSGPIQAITTAPLYVDLTLAAGQSLQLLLPAGHQALVYPFEGEVYIGAAPETAPTTAGQTIDAATLGNKVSCHYAAILTDGELLTLNSLAPVRLLVLAGRPLREPVVQYGPFVMNHVSEIEQAIRDYQAGTLTQKVAGTLAV